MVRNILRMQEKSMTKYEINPQRARIRILHYNSVEVLNNTDGIIDAIHNNLKNPYVKLEIFRSLHSQASGSL